jgi:hypothetical protein
MYDPGMFIIIRIGARIQKKKENISRIFSEHPFMFIYIVRYVN